MTTSERARIEQAIELFLEARKMLGSDGSFRSRVLLDMLLLQLGKEFAESSNEAVD